MGSAVVECARPGIDGMGLHAEDPMFTQGSDLKGMGFQQMCFGGVTFWVLNKSRGNFGNSVWKTLHCLPFYSNI